MKDEKTVKEAARDIIAKYGTEEKAAEAYRVIARAVEKRDYSTEYRLRRQAAGISQHALAAAAGLNPTTVWKIETGRVKPHAATRRVLEAALRKLERRSAQSTAASVEPA